MKGTAGILFCECSIRNRKQLCEELSLPCGPDRAADDRAILLLAYERWGSALVHHLYGGFTQPGGGPKGSDGRGNDRSL